MADNIMINVNPTFNMGAFSEQLANIYRSKGYVVNIIYLNNGCMITFEKDLGGINTLLGLGQGIKLNCSLNGNILNVFCSDAEWTSKIIAIAVGWFMCLIPFVTGIVGGIQQYSLPNNLTNDARMIAMNM